ncbi:hypothetical protein AD929_03515 [Gluconobacter potus]|uniref:Type 4 secretion system PilS N-terminal domain-containing protein n=1 Tax=Gluconobacter potus TaxID=2724927 RepID=A0A149QXY8_9PROT|nr:hypothetical protein [Gluconobacter potus]KXV02183.1 hypothetical protein AD929_03515 [Gluconobacter potus]
MTYALLVTPRRLVGRVGLGLLETLLALFIAGLVTAGAILLYQHSQEKKQLNEFMQEVALFHGLARNVFGNQATLPNYASSQGLALIRTGRVPRNLYQGVALQTPWKTPVQVFVGNWAGFFAFQSYNLTYKQCLDVATAPIGTDMHDINVNGHVSTGAQSITLADAEGQCLQNSGNWVIYNYKS